MLAGEGTKTLRWGVLRLGLFFCVLAYGMFVSARIGWWQGSLFLAVFLLQISAGTISPQAEGQANSPGRQAPSGAPIARIGGRGPFRGRGRCPGRRPSARGSCGPK